MKKKHEVKVARRPKAKGLCSRGFEYVRGEKQLDVPMTLVTIIILARNHPLSAKVIVQQARNLLSISARFIVLFPAFPVRLNLPFALYFAHLQIRNVCLINQQLKSHADG